MLIFLQKKANEAWRLITLFSLRRETALKRGPPNPAPCFGATRTSLYSHPRQTLDFIYCRGFALCTSM